jgi:hypothetical protein
MHIDEFREFQREGATYNLASLVMACRRKFLNAARLLEVRSQVIDRLSSFGVDAGVDPWPLLGPFTVLAERYVERFFSPQDNLFQDPMERQDEKWGKYFHHVLVPHLLTNDEVVRNVLRAVRALPSQQPEQAAIALSQYFAETTLPETRPLWAPEDIVDY